MSRESRLAMAILVASSGCAPHEAPAASEPHPPRPARTVAEIVVAPAAPEKTAKTAKTPPPRSPEPPVRPTATDDPRGSVACVRAMRDGLGLPADEAQAGYDEARGAEEVGDKDRARKGYFAIIQQFPGSPRIPLSYLGFAEMFAAETRTDASRAELAKQAYAEVLRQPDPEGTRAAFVGIRMASMHRIAGEPAKALTTARRAVTEAKRVREPACSDALAEAAAEELVAAFFAGAGDPGKAVAFFRSVDAAGASTMTALLAETYARAGQRREACAVASSTPAPADERARERLASIRATACAPP